MKKKKIIMIGVACLLCAGIGYFKFRAKQSAPEMPVVSVQAMKVSEQSMPVEIRAIGTLVAQAIEITPEEAGHVQAVLFKDGDFVDEHAPLLQLDDAVHRTKDELAKAKLAFSAANYKRTEFLGKKGIVAKQAVDQAEADYKEKKADAKETEVMLQKMRLEAPFAGVVGKSKVNRGDYVTIGQSIVSLTDTKHLRIEYNVPEKYLPLLKKGQAVKIKTNTYKDKIFWGEVAFISPTINPDNRSISLYATVTNDDNVLAPGMFVNITQMLGSKERVVMIPARSLVPVLDGEQVFKVVDGKAFAVNVLLGKRNKDDVQITEGLKPGDLVVTDGQLKIRNGSPVKLTT